MGVSRPASRVGRVVGLLRWLLACAGGAAAGALLQRGFQPAAAEHSRSPHLHVRSQMYDSDPETTCVGVIGGSLTQAQARQRVADTLVSASHPLEDWHGVDYVNFYGQIMTEPCPQPVPAPLSESLRLEFWEFANSQDSCAGGEGCTLFIDQWGNWMTEGHAVRAQIRIKDSAFNERTINHEVGHALGLCDGGPSAPEWEEPYCGYSLIARDCTGSVMHTYGCGNASQWPTDADRLEVQRVSHGGGSGWGGGGGSDICNRGFC